MSKFLKILFGLAVLVGFSVELKAPPFSLSSDDLKKMASDLVKDRGAMIKKYTDQAFYAGVDPETGQIIPNKQDNSRQADISQTLYKTMPGYRKAIEQKVAGLGRINQLRTVDTLLNHLRSGLISRFKSRRTGFKNTYVLQYMNIINGLNKLIETTDDYIHEQYRNSSPAEFNKKYLNFLCAQMVFQDLLFALWDCAAIQGRQERFLKDRQTGDFIIDRSTGQKMEDFRQLPRQHFYGIPKFELLTPTSSADATGRPVNKPLMDCGLISTIFFRFNVIGYVFQPNEPGLYLLMEPGQVEQFIDAIQHFINLAMGERPSSPRFPVPTEFFSSTRSSDSFRYQTFPPSTNFGGREGSLPHVTWGSSIRSQSPSRQKLTSTFERKSSIFPQQRPSSPRSPRQQGANRLSQDPSSFSRLFGDQFPTLVRTSSQSTSPLRSSLLVPPFPSEESLTSANFPVHSNLESQKKGKEKELNTVVPVIPPVSSPRRSPSPAPVFPSEFFLSTGPISFRGPSSSPSSSPMPFSEILLTAPVILPSQPQSSPKSPLRPAPASPKRFVSSSSSSSVAPISAPMPVSVPVIYSSSSSVAPSGSPKGSPRRPALTPLILPQTNFDLDSAFEAATVGFSSSPVVSDRSKLLPKKPSSSLFGNPFLPSDSITSTGSGRSGSVTQAFPPSPKQSSLTPPPPSGKDEAGWFRSGLNAVTTGLLRLNPFGRSISKPPTYSRLLESPSADKIATAELGALEAAKSYEDSGVSSAILSRPLDTSRGRPVNPTGLSSRRTPISKGSGAALLSKPLGEMTGPEFDQVQEARRRVRNAKKGESDAVRAKNLELLKTRTADLAAARNRATSQPPTANPGRTTPLSKPSASGTSSKPAMYQIPDTFFAGPVPNFGLLPSSSSLTGEPPH